jgi:hypothetical protein
MTKTPYKILQTVVVILDNFSGCKSIGEPITKYGELVAMFGEDDESVFTPTEMLDGSMLSECTYLLDNNGETGAYLIQGKDVDSLYLKLRGKPTLVAKYSKDGKDLLSI